MLNKHWKFAKDSGMGMPLTHTQYTVDTVQYYTGMDPLWYWYYTVQYYARHPLSQKLLTTYPNTTYPHVHITHTAHTHPTHHSHTTHALTDHSHPHPNIAHTPRARAKTRRRVKVRDSVSGRVRVRARVRGTSVRVRRTGKGKDKGKCKGKGKGQGEVCFVFSYRCKSPKVTKRNKTQTTTPPVIFTQLTIGPAFCDTLPSWSFTHAPCH